MSVVKQVVDKLDWFCNKRAHSSCWFDSCCGVSWAKCSAMHDKRYDNKRLTRAQADELLYRCVYKKSKLMAWIMYTGVRLVGWYFYDKATNPV